VGGYALAVRATVTFAVGVVLAAAGPAAARSPEAFGRHAVRVTHVQIPVPVDPSGPEGVLPTVAADVYVPSGPGRRQPVQIAHALTLPT